ncbi:MAG: S41 family peptidase, partial [Patescibacteria group bacterium]
MHQFENYAALVIILPIMDIKEKLGTDNLSTRAPIITQVVISLILIIAIFGMGFYAGRNRRPATSIDITNTTNEVDKRADFEPFWKTWEALEEKFVPASTTTKKVSDQEKIWGAIEGLASSYGDPYTTFFPPVESKIFSEEISGSFNGVGMEIASQDGILTVVAPLKGTPADRAEVKPGDKIIQIDDKPSAKMPVDEAISLIRGEAGTSVTISFAREGVKDLLVKTIPREPIAIPTTDTKLLPSGVFVISLYSFSETSADLFRGALREFVESKRDKLILDLRNNPGGYLEAAVSMASWFLPTGKVIVTEDFGGKRESVVHRSHGYDIFNENLKFVILVNGGSASASEIMAGALSEYGKATLVGEKTFGKGSVQELVDITKDTSLKVTVAHWLTPLGNSISSGGLKPQIEVKITPEDVKAGKDPQLDRAVEY